MSSMAIGIGLTHIRLYDFARTGFFYSGLLSFASGIERLAKLILIYDYRLSNSGAYPTDRFLRRIGHGVDTLINKAIEINTTRSLNVDDAPLVDPIVGKIIPILTDFATQSRYYNLDYLTGHIQPGDEPLKRWDNNVCSLIVQRHHRISAKKQVMQDQLANFIEDLDFVSVLFSNEQGNEIRSVSDMMLSTALIGMKQRYSMFYLYQIAHFLTKVFTELEYRGNFFPYLREFFILFLNDDRRFITNKKSWNPTPPYHF